MNAVLIRIVMRYAAGALVAKGLLSADLGSTLAGDPDVMAVLEVGAGLAISAATEGAYWLAKRFGWAT